MSCGIGHRHGSDLVLLWLWCRPAAVAPFRPLAWELLYAVGAALKSKKKKKRERERERTKTPKWGSTRHVTKTTPLPPSPTRVEGYVLGNRAAVEPRV